MGNSVTKAGILKATNRLAGLYSCSYSKAELEFWWLEIGAMGKVTDGMLMDAAEALRLGEKEKWKPNLNTFLFYLEKERTRAIEILERKLKEEGNRREIIGSRRLGPKGKKLRLLTHALFDGKITRPQFEEEHRKVSGYDQ